MGGLNSLVDCGVQSDPTEFSLKPDTSRVKWAGCSRIEGGSALGIRVVMIVLGKFVS